MYYFDQKEVILLVTLTQGYTYWENKPSFQLESDIGSNYVMYIIESGSCEFEFSQYSGIASANDILLIPPYVKFKRNMLEPMCFHFIRVIPDPVTPTFIGKHHLGSHRFYENCEFLRKTNFSLNTDSHYIQNHIVEDFFMLLKIKKFKPIEPKQALSRNNIINSAIELMEHNSSLSISEIAQFTNTSTAYFSRIFKKTIGETPVCFYTKIKLKKVQKLLITTNLTLAEISEQTGFTDPFYLSKVFTTHLGCSPRTYRKNHII